MLAVVDIRSRPGQGPSEIEKSLFANVIKKNIRQYMGTGIFKHPTGKLRDSIRVAISGDSIYIMSDLPYADIQENGTSQAVKAYLRTQNFIGGTGSNQARMRAVFKKKTLKETLFPTGNLIGKKFVWTGVELAKLEMPQIATDRTVTLTENPGGLL